MNFQQQSYPGFPGQSQPTPQHLQQPQQQQQQQFRPQGYPQAGVMMPAQLTAMMAQGYAQQQQLLQQQQQQQQQQHPSGGAMPTPMRPPMAGMSMHGMPQGMTPQMMMAAQQQMHLHQMNQSPSTSIKKKKHRPQNAQVARSHQPRPHDAYVKAAMGAPGVEVEPWADALDELDPRELAMGRFRARQEILTEIFGPERIKDISIGKGDAWEGLGMEGETLEEKVLALEKENAELEAKGDSEVEAWRRHIGEISEGVGA